MEWTNQRTTARALIQESYSRRRNKWSAGSIFHNQYHKWFRVAASLLLKKKSRLGNIRKKYSAKPYIFLFYIDSLLLPEFLTAGVKLPYVLYIQALLSVSGI
ncbi:hypothetical protein T310_3267 [Rasamsonia emersonii CBS 393.64]|uniref:Uncharacterized protein n=1 Tax=Rasamsonia emersonii (strain ATCC 16479 / CBS 393.64 / IMI 116815) TaxID=1408163 RepID=A0A0F4YWX7_RASE3|nr:hypothetical protein T310_3267 [Rasamsonia emersonii CBS 393.64]KKA22724.1 hypothetical protein T310_3267 [Rasamsonia emersonii CBS 393.64]